MWNWAPAFTGINITSCQDVIHVSLNEPRAIIRETTFIWVSSVSQNLGDTPANTAVSHLKHRRYIETSNFMTKLAHQSSSPVLFREAWAVWWKAGEVSGEVQHTHADCGDDGPFTQRWIVRQLELFGRHPEDAVHVQPLSQQVSLRVLIRQKAVCRVLTKLARPYHAKHVMITCCYRGTLWLLWEETIWILELVF